MRAIKAYRKSSSFVVSFVFTSLLMFGVGFNSYTLSVANDDLLIRETEAAIQADIGGFRSLYNTAGRKAVIQAVEDRLQSYSNDFLYFLKDSDANYISGNLASWPEDNVDFVKNGLLEIRVELREEYRSEQSSTTRAVAMVMEFSNKDTLLVARNVQDIEFAVALAQTSSWVMIAILCIVAIGSLGVAYYVVTRINKISDTADAIISTGDLSDRLHVDSSWDDLSKLTLVLNQLLDKIEQSVHAISLVSDNIAHDLRTPLTRLQSHIEVINDDEEKQQLRKECDNLLGIFNSLLRISDIENTSKRAGFALISLTDVANDAVDLYLPIAESKQIEVHSIIEDQTPILENFYGDKNLLFQAFANVLDNAIKFTPEHGKIEIHLTSHNKQIVFSVNDTGSGVNAQSIDKLTRRFFREEKSRTTVGNGLGLSLVSAIIALHDGDLIFEKSHIPSTTKEVGGGLCCKMIFSVA
ncbi:sensor histidine kinase [Glaciecola petra]|uniref:histidine kinase n=1 Tax=Glaciecola petra TaxID=3075602 RepID=A0ABU2ZMG9_9ALTE|nr:HAMP domain-containing sensor histidine kinase [Aestuariibacter sp. P117]MDT0593441.1 HAMP domain-containing sensor histidine kinase [Aestuariibacter sp. P117]